MDFMELAKARYSVRKFDPLPVEEEKVEAILAAALAAPTAKNLQPQRLLVLKSREALEKLTHVTGCTYGCPLAFVVCYDESVCWHRSFDGKSSGDVDASIVTTHMMLAGWEQGIGSTWVMAFDPAALRREYHLPENIRPTAILVMGYAAPDAVPSPNHAASITRDQMVAGESF